MLIKSSVDHSDSWRINGTNEAQIDILLANEAAERKRKREEDEALQASAEEEFITVSKRDLVFVLRVSRRAIEAARKCGDFLEKGLLAFRAQETIFYEAKGAAERM